MATGPQPMTSNQRWALVEQIAAQIQAFFGADLLALGVYGSVGRGSDGPYSDIEIFCVVRGEEIDTSYEWTAGPWKAEVDVYSSDVLLAEAAKVEGDWAISHGAFLNVRPLYDPQDFFQALRQAVLQPNAAAFEWAMRGLIVGEIYEVVGKVRNAAAQNNPSPLSAYAVELAHYGACLAGLAQRTPFHGSSAMLAESLALPDLPAGYPELCCQVMSGRLDDAALLLAQVNSFWKGVEAWAAARRLNFYTTLEQLLADSQVQD